MASIKGPFITTAAQLCKKLRENYTGENKLEILRELLRKNPNASAEDGYKALELATNVTQRTLDKARGLIDTGEVPPAVNAYEQATAIEDVILSNLQRAADESAARAAAERKAADEKKNAEKKTA